MFVWSDTLRNWKGDKVLTPKNLRNEHGPFLTLSFASATLLSDDELSAYGIKRIKREELISYAAIKRKEALGGSIIVELGNGSINVWVDPESRASLTASVLAAVINPDHSVRWKGADGAFHDLAFDDLILLGTSVMSRVQSLFDKEAEVVDEIVSGTITDFEQIDAKF